MQDIKTSSVVSRITAAIRSGKYPSGASLPSERELTGIHGVSRITVRAALSKLERTGAISRIKGKGTFVAPRGRPASASLLASTIHLIYTPCHWPDAEDLFTISLLKEISPLLARQGKGLRLSPLLPGVTLGNLLDKYDLSDFASGVILSMIDHPAGDVISRLHEAAIPLVSLGRVIGEDSVPFVESDHRIGARAAVRHLLEHGHARIAFFGGPFENFSMAESQREGYRQAMAEAGASLADEWICEVPMWDEAAGFKACESWLKRKTGCTAMVVSGGEATVGVMRALGGRGIRVPDGMAVVMYTDFPWNRPALPMPMTAVSESIAGLAWNLVDLLERIREGGEGASNSRILIPELVRRRSCGCGNG